MLHLPPAWIFVTTTGLRVADQMQMQLAPPPPTLQLPHSVRLQPALVIQSPSFSVTINEIHMTVQRATNEPSHSFAVERRAVGGSGPSVIVDQLLSLLRRLSNAEVTADLQRRLRQLAEQGQPRPSPSTSASSSECCACRSAAPSVLYRPCLHLCMCAQCDRQMANNQCPLCRAAIQTRLQPVRLA